MMVRQRALRQIKSGKCDVAARRFDLDQGKNVLPSNYLSGFSTDMAYLGGWNARYSSHSGKLKEYL
jgi:hypothetical protein